MKRGAPAGRLGVERAETLADLEGGKGRAQGMVLVSHRRPEEGHEAVAQELVDRPLVPVHGGQRQLEEAVQEVVHGLGADVLGQCRGALEVAEEDGHHLPLPLDGAPGGQDLVSEMLRRVAGWRGVFKRLDRTLDSVKPPAALCAEFIPRRVVVAALRTGSLQASSALAAELRR